MDARQSTTRDAAKWASPVVFAVRDDASPSNHQPYVLNVEETMMPYSLKLYSN